MTEAAPTSRFHAIGFTAFLGAATLLFFHPGAFDWDRLKLSFLLCLALPLVLLSLGPRQLRLRLGTPWPRELLLFAALPGVLLISSLGHLRLDGEGIRLLAGLFTLAVLAVLVRRQPSDRPLVLPAWLLGAGALAGAYALLQAAGLDPFYAYIPEREPVSTLGNTNAMAEVMALLLPLGICLIFDNNRRAIGLGMICLPFIVGALWVSGGRAGVVAALFGGHLTMLILLRQIRKKGRRSDYLIKLVLMNVGVLGGMGLGYLMGPPENLALKKIDSPESLFSTEYPTNKVRLETWKSTLRLISDQPLLGTGPGQFQQAFWPYRSSVEAELPGLMGAPTRVDHPHNEYLWAAAEGGIVAALVFLGFLLLVLLHCLKKGFAGAGSLSGRLALGIAGSVLAFAVLCFFRAPLHSPAAAGIFFLLAGLAGQEKATGQPGRWSKALLWPGLLVLTCVSLVFGVRGLAADWLASSVAISDKIGSAEFTRLQRAADWDPTHVDINNFVGQIAANRLMGTEADRDGRFRQEAIKRLESVLEHHPAHPDALRTLSRVYALEGRTLEASDLLAKCYSLLQEDQAPDEAIVELLEKADMNLEAAAFLKNRFPDNPDRLLERGQQAFDAGNPERAACYADRYLSLNPFDGDALYLLGQCMKARFEGSEKPIYRRMHIAYALDWLEKGDLKQARRSVRSSQRYGDGEGEAQILEALIKRAEGQEVELPDLEIKNKAFLDRVDALTQ